MDASERARLNHAVAEATLAVAGLEVTLATLRDDGVIGDDHLMEILHRLKGLIDALDTQSTEAIAQITDIMNQRLSAMAAYLSVTLRDS